MKELLRDILIFLVVALLICQTVMLIDIRIAVHSDCAEEIPDKAGEMHREKQEHSQKPGKLIPNPQLPQWDL